MKFNPVFQRQKNVVANGYSSFPMDNLLNMTSVCGYLIPVYWDYLNPGDKVNLRTLLRTKTQPLTSPAMATVIERLEWFAVPIDQIYKPFSTKFYGINDIQSDLFETGQYNDYLPYIPLSSIAERIVNLPSSFEAQSALPVETPTKAEAKRLCDSLGCPKVLGSNSTNVYPASVSAFPFAAYQKIYYDHYRLTDREVNDPQAYNLDSFQGTSQTSALVDNTSRLNKLLTLRKRPYMRDYFTSMQVSPLFGSADVNASGVDLGIIQQWLSGLSKVSTAVPSDSVQQPDGGATSVSDSNPSTTRIANAYVSGLAAGQLAQGSFNPANIRSLFAVEKLLTVTRNAKKHYDMQTLAHFGVDVPKGLSGECFKLGTHEQYLQIGEVVGTATTQDSSLGELAGRGSSEGQGKPIHFEAKCHCVLMCIYSAEPVVNIQNDGLPRLLSMCNASEFYKSEFDSLGLQPVFYRELMASGYAPTDVESNNYNKVIGWQPRYQQLKCKYNRSIAGITTTAFSEWALNRTPVASNGVALSRNFFYVWPTDMDNILNQTYNHAHSHSSTYSYDYFINQIYFDVQKASKMSVFGTPKL